MNASVPVPVSRTDTTVTLSRADWEAHLNRLEDAADLATVVASREDQMRLGGAEYERLCYTAAEVERMIEGESAVAIWRGRAGLTQRDLAAAALVSASYLAEIEAGRKPGSAAALSRLAKVLAVPMEHLVAEGIRNGAEA